MCSSYTRILINIGCLKGTECTRLSKSDLVEIKRSYISPNIADEARTESQIARQKKYIEVSRENLIVITKRNLLHDYLSFSSAFSNAILER